jgi:hypothetical protein
VGVVSIMERLFFYSRSSGTGRIADCADDQFHALPVITDFAPWTHVTYLPLQGRLLFYNQETQNAVTAFIGANALAGEKTYDAGSFGSWTHIVGVLGGGHGSAFFYNSAVGSAAVGFDPTTREWNSGTFSRGWTHVVTGRQSWRVLFYNANTGAGAIDFEPSTTFPPGSFSSNWTHVAAGPTLGGGDGLLFYSSARRAAAIGLLDGSGFRTVQAFADGSFGAWTHIVGLDAGFFFYNATSGAAAIGVLDAAGFRTTMTFPAGSLETGWTHILRTEDVVVPGDLLATCWPMSVRPGQTFDLRVSSPADTYDLTVLRYRAQPADQVDVNAVVASNELASIAISGPLSGSATVRPYELDPAKGCLDWPITTSLTVPEDWSSDIYVGHLVDKNGSETFVPLVVQPSPDSTARLALIANTNTWSAYNNFGGYNRYSVPSPGSWEFSNVRPHMGAFDPTRTDKGYHDTSKHLLRGELWILSWLRDNGYQVDVHTDLDLHAGIDELAKYRGLILSTHPEYWSLQMLDALESYLDAGGSLIYLGGNGIYDVVDIADDYTSITIEGQQGTGRTRLFRHPIVGRPESAVLGIAFPWRASPGHGDIGNNYYERVSYQVVDPAHRFFSGTGATAGDTFGSQGWNTSAGAASLFEGGASGWECDVRDENSPAVELLAQGTNPLMTDGVAIRSEMVTYAHDGGGIVFSAGSISFGGSLLVDPMIQRIVRNVLDEVISP